MSDDLGRIGLEFSGKVTASISHEIKNRLAVINEQAGLLEDHVGLGQQGRALDLERLGRLAATVQRQVALANTILKNMNRFAHSADKPSQPVDVNEAVELSAALSQRAADMREVTLDVQKLDEPPVLTTSFFRLLNLFWICLNSAIEITVTKGVITVNYGKNADKTALIIQMAVADGKKINKEMTASADMLAADIGLSVDMDSAEGIIAVNFE